MLVNSMEKLRREENALGLHEFLSGHRETNRERRITITEEGVFIIIFFHHFFFLS